MMTEDPGDNHSALDFACQNEIIKKIINAPGCVVGHKISCFKISNEAERLEIDALVTAVQEMGRLVKVARTPTIDAVLALVQGTFFTPNSAQ